MVPYMEMARCHPISTAVQRSPYRLPTAFALDAFGRYGSEITAKPGACDWPGENACARSFSFCLHSRVSVFHESGKFD